MADDLFAKKYFPTFLMALNVSGKKNKCVRFRWKKTAELVL